MWKVYKRNPGLQNKCNCGNPSPEQMKGICQAVEPVRTVGITEIEREELGMSNGKASVFILVYILYDHSEKGGCGLSQGLSTLMFQS